MKSSIIIKGNKYGFQIVLNPELSFEDLLKEVAVKFKESGGFFDQNKALAVSFSGRKLSEEEQNLLVDTIVDNSGLKICYIIDGAKVLESNFARAFEKTIDHQPEDYSEKSGGNMDLSKESDPEEQSGDSLKETASTEAFLEESFLSEQRTEKNGQFYRGTLRSGQSIEVDGSIVILGDINPGAQVVAGGNVVVLGCVKGTITAGYPSDQSAVVAALMMEPMQIKIGNIIARSPDQKSVKPKKRFHKKQTDQIEPKIAFVENDNIFIETITRSLISEFSTSQHD